ncbi:unnamed protein product [Parajaminaea phylloscopi]
MTPNDTVPWVGLSAARIQELMALIGEPMPLAPPRTAAEARVILEQCHRRLLALPDIARLAFATSELLKSRGHAGMSNAEAIHMMEMVRLVRQRLGIPRAAL